MYTAANSSVHLQPLPILTKKRFVDIESILPNMIRCILKHIKLFTTTIWKGKLFSLVEHVALVFVGDISFSGPIKYYVEHKYHTYNDSFDEVAPYIRQADISIGNLESPFVNQDVYRHMYKGKKVMILDSSPEAAPALRYNVRIKSLNVL